MNTYNTIKLSYIQTYSVWVQWKDGIRKYFKRYSDFVFDNCLIDLSFFN